MNKADQEDNELCRAEFEKWCVEANSPDKVHLLHHGDSHVFAGTYIDNSTQFWWEGWRAAWNRPQSTDGDEVSRLRDALRDLLDGCLSDRSSEYGVAQYRSGLAKAKQTLSNPNKGGSV